MPLQVIWIWLGAMADALRIVGALEGRVVQVVAAHCPAPAPAGKRAEAIRVFQFALPLPVLPPER
ncbi:MAG: hypothetical protein DME97_06965 [Verrucomicrobia bacterium]|nr:MAG: hypothetical protein DME97_06965 [Verrucomicrobiota bacterium]